MTPESERVSLDAVRQAEIEYITERRVLSAKAVQRDFGPPAQSLVGLALSGGGIRSATTNLGVLQALSRMGILPLVDYLCTVSGGGYIGACLSALLSVRKQAGGPWQPTKHELSQPKEALFTSEWKEFPFRDELGDWPTSGRHEVKHLRTHGNFLITRKGLLTTETLRSIGGVITGIIHHWVLFLLALAVIAGFGLWLTLGILAPSAGALLEASPDKASSLWKQMEPSLGQIGPSLGAAARSWWDDSNGPFWMATKWGAAIAVLVFMLAVIAIPAHQRWGVPLEGESTEDAFHRGLLKWVRRLGLLVLAYVALHLRLNHAPYTSDTSVPSLLSWLFLPLWLALAFWMSALVIYLVLPWGEIVAWRGKVGERVRHFWTRQFRSSWGSVVALGLYWVIGAAALGVFPFAAHAVGNVGVYAIFTALATALVSRGVATRVTGIPGIPTWLSTRVKKALLSVLVGLFIVTVVVLLGSWLVSWPLTDAVSWVSAWTGNLPRSLLASSFLLASSGAFVLLILAGLFGNSNKIGLHYFYRDRLIETFLQTEVTNKSLTLDLAHDTMDMRLKELHGAYKVPNKEPDYRRCITAAPYLLISCAINLAERRDLTRRDRKSGYFTFSKLYCGSYHTGYRATTEYQAGEVKLGRAMTISGAAVGSGMGFHTFFAQAFATTLFNLRLGYWMENPGKPPRLLRSRAERPIFSPWYLLREMLSWTHSRGRLVNLSDGGHTGDNVGIYPLLQRRCKVIVACDVEADPILAFGSFTEALRHAYIDMSIDVDIDLTMIRPDPATGRSRSHCAIGRIRYPDAGTAAPAEAWLIYLKSSLTGDEPEPTKNYKVAHPAFPHESTADQFFDDAQFESYRALGNHLAEHAFHPVESAGIPFTEGWLRSLLSEHSPFKVTNKSWFDDAKVALQGIEDQLASDPSLAWYQQQCSSSGAPPPSPLPPPSPALLSRVCLKQIRLMEHVFLTFELRRYANAPDNRGWMNLFRAWGRSPAFQSEFKRVEDFLVWDFVEFYRAFIEGKGLIDASPIPHPWDVQFRSGDPEVFLDPGRRA